MHDLDAFEFVILGKSTEAFSTAGNQCVNSTGLNLLLVVGLQLLKDFIHTLPLLVVATTLEEVTTEVGYFLVHFFE